MLTLQQIKENPERVVERLAVKGFDGKDAIARVIELDTQRRQLQFKNDNLAAELKKKADSIGRLMKEGKRDEAEQAKPAARCPIFPLMLFRIGISPASTTSSTSTSA